MAAEHVILLHGLARTKRSMRPMAKRLEAEGYKVTNIGYDSRHYDVKELADRIDARISATTELGERVHFVTHSLGGILVRLLDKRTGSTYHIGRVVMLAPPNLGSEVVDRLKDFRSFRWINGPAGEQLGTDPDSMPNQLGPPAFEFGVIAGCRSINRILSRFIPGPNDGKVSVKNTKLEGMSDHLVVEANHPFIMRDKEAMEATLRFLRKGTFHYP